MGKSVNCVSKSDEKALRNRISLYVANGANPRVMAAESGVGWGVFQHIHGGDNRDGVTSLTFRKLSEWMNDHPEYSPKTKRCPRCGKEKPVDQFHKDATKADGLHIQCKECVSEYQKSRKERKMEAITKELVEKVKGEDKPDVESKYMAAYFGITPAILDDIRAGKHDGLLLTPEPEPETDLVAAVNALRDELNRTERKLDALMLELGVNVA